MDITKIDSNFKIETKLDLNDVKFYNVTDEPFKIYGVFHEGGLFRRLPQNVGEMVSEGVSYHHTNSAGGRVRFKTNSPYVAIYAKMPRVCKLSHFALTGSAGFDLYTYNDSYRYVGTYIPPFDIKDGFESVVRFPGAEERDITINFPLYSQVSELYIGVKDGAKICEPSPYKYEKPIVYYGSSITQGGCASRPGMSYEAVLSRRFNADYINLGFSGSAKGEDEIAEYISNLDMSVFVYDYDYNAPTPEHLKNTHEKMFKKIREKNPDLPIIIMSRPRYYLCEIEERNLDIVKTTYENAIKNGDENVYFIDGKNLMALCKNEGVVDNCHPTDLGFWSMSTAVGEVLETILK